MANEPDYNCTRCGSSTSRDLLTVKKSVFMEMGAGSRTLKSRVTDWLCPSCVKKDPEWNLDKFVAPGAKLARRRSNSGALSG